MVKFKTTKKEIMNGYRNIISVEYCELQHLLKYENPIAYTCGKDGWHADIYEIDYSTVIVTGYAPFGNYIPSYDYCKQYEKLAEEVAEKNHYGDCREEYKQLLGDFVFGAITEENRK